MTTLKWGGFLEPNLRVQCRAGTSNPVFKLGSPLKRMAVSFSCPFKPTTKRLPEKKETDPSTNHYAFCFGTSRHTCYAPNIEQKTGAVKPRSVPLQATRLPRDRLHAEAQDPQRQARGAGGLLTWTRVVLGGGHPLVGNQKDKRNAWEEGNRRKTEICLGGPGPKKWGPNWGILVFSFRGGENRYGILTELFRL